MKRFFVLAAIALPLCASASGEKAPAGSKQPGVASTDGMSLLAGISGGVLVPFSKLSASVAATVEAGALMRWTGHEIGGTVGVSYEQPTASGGLTDPRVPGGSYTWDLGQRSLAVTPSLLYRMTSLGFIVPYASVGPRISFMEQTGSGAAGSNALGATTETLARIGARGRVGAEFLLGFGGITVDALFEWAPLGSVSAGAGTSLMGISAQVGYRLVL